MLARRAAEVLRRTMHAAAAAPAGAPLSTPLKVLFCGLEFHDGYALTAAQLAGDARFHVTRCAREDVATHIADAHLAVPFMARIDAPLLARAPQLRYVLQFGVGLEGVDMPAARAAGVRVANIPSGDTGNAAACAEFALFLTLALLRDVHGMATAFAQRRLGAPTGRLLAGRAALLVGFGAIGRETARRLAALGVRVAAVRAGAWPAPGADAAADADAALLTHRGSGPDDMRSMLGEADVVILTCTLHAGTRGMVDAAFLAAMRPGAFLVNVARGGLLDYDAVRAALEANTLGGLGTDVAWSEPWDPADAVAAHPRVLMTPHVAGVTDVSYNTMARIVAEEARRLADGAAPGPGVAVFVEGSRAG